MLYSNYETFLSELSNLFDDAKKTGKSVWITIKQYDGRTTRNPRKPNDKPKRTKKGAPKGGDPTPISKEHKCLIRAKSGDRKISTSIDRSDMSKFQVSYSSIIKRAIPS